MNIRIVVAGLALALFSMLLSACQQKLVVASPVLEPVAFSDRQWTGLAVSKNERLFVNYPRWSDNVPVSVAEIVDGKAVPYPDVQMNSWKPGLDPATHFVSVQAVFIDTANRLWILDPANPQFKGVVEGGPKLVEVDLETNSIKRVYRFGPDIAPVKSYLNDVRIDVERNFAYMTDSDGSALVALNLETGKARRFLDSHPSTESEDVTLTIGGTPWMFMGGKPQIHADGIAYDAAKDMLFYQALTGRTMYRLPAAALRNQDVTDNEVAAQTEIVGKTGAADGLYFGPDAKVYISALEHDAILRTTPDGRVETVIQDAAISWPDSFSMGPDGKLYFTTSRIHEGAQPKAPYGVYRIALP
ncbi:L-dopachrome tautomerase-related protein [Oleidesulfovibrio sp.]|uniref:L-dopachrome tautomerase-related protein n=1 Tax=Oleidesulfovibrio sp. TaxID=2909707 RepID=UPI003A8562F2